MTSEAEKEVDRLTKASNTDSGTYLLITNNYNDRNIIFKGKGDADVMMYGIKMSIEDMLKKGTKVQRKMILKTLIDIVVKEKLKVFIMMILVLFCLLFCLLLTGCSNQITEGEVYNKEYRPSELQIIPTTMVHSNGKTTYTTIVPITWYYPERDVIFIKAYDSELKKWRTEDYYVEKETYDLINIGDYFVFDKNTMLQDEPREKQ